MNENRRPVIKARTELRKPANPVDLEQERELRQVIGEEPEFHANEVIETMAPDAYKGHLNDDDDENITPVKSPSNETGMSAGA